jgi:hypothetical protein
MEGLTEKIIVAAIFILGLGIGWALNESWEAYTNEQTLNGLWFGNGNWNYTEVKYSANKLDSSGQWVCVNINKETSYQDIIKICEHEASHELFARQCTANVSECMELMKLMDKKK